MCSIVPFISLISDPLVGSAGAGMELQGPIMTQPGAGAVPLGCPPGLEYLTQVDHLIVKGKVELLEAFTGDLVPSIIFVTHLFHPY